MKMTTKGTFIIRKIKLKFLKDVMKKEGLEKLILTGRSESKRVRRRQFRRTSVNGCRNLVRKTDKGHVCDCKSDKVCVSVSLLICMCFYTCVHVCI